MVSLPHGAMSVVVAKSLDFFLVFEPRMIRKTGTLTNGVDPNEMPQNAASL